MPKRGDKSTAAIQELLDERRKIEQWLQRLDMAADQTAAGVRDRVKSDYKARLDKVVAELQGYGDDLRASLESQRAKFADFKTQETAASEELAEAELRHAVGEFAEDEWSERKAEILEVLVKVREGLAEAEGEMSELTEVLRELEAPVEVEPEPAPAEAEVDEPTPTAAAAEPRMSLGSELGLRDIGAGSDAEDAPTENGERTSQTEAFGDELAFLKSVTRKSGVAESGVVHDEPPPVLDGTDAEAEVGADAVEKLAADDAIEQSRPSSVNQRTLKCGECGAMNLPTEWYCDRCGAELAAL